MKIAFRTDASDLIGTGHFMRCITLADKLKKHSVKIRFISRDLPQHLMEILNLKGFEYTPLKKVFTKELIDELPHARWLGTSQIKDARETIQALADNIWDWIVVDHYALDERWEKIIINSVRQLMVIDDLANRRHNCDVLLDQNLNRNEAEYKKLVPKKCDLFVGVRYALIREEFWKLRNKKKIHNTSVKKNILIFFSGADVNNYTGRTLETLSTKEFDGINVDVVIGADNKFSEEIKLKCNNFNFRCHIQTNQMAEFMHKSDLFIGAGGGSINERIFMKLPSVAIAVSSNQIEPLEKLSQTGSCVYLGPGESLSDINFKKSILYALQHIEFLTKKSEKLCAEFILDQTQLLERLLIKRLR